MTWLRDLIQEHNAHVRYADAEQSKQTGGMIALFPRTDAASEMVVPNGEPLQDLHCTLVFLGDDVTDQPDAPDPLLQSLANLANSFTVIDAPVIGRAVFDGGAVVYLIEKGSQLTDLQQDVQDAAATVVSLPEQHTPYTPHVTVGYDINPRQLNFTGTVLFDRIGLAYAGRTHYLPLLGATVSEYAD